MMKKAAKTDSGLKKQVRIQIAMYAAAFFLFVSGLIAGVRIGQPLGGIMVLAAFAIAVLNILWFVLKFIRSGKKEDLMLLIRIAIQLAFYVLAFFIFFLGLGIGLALNPLMGMILVLSAFAMVGLNTAWLVMWLVKSGKK